MFRTICGAIVVFLFASSVFTEAQSPSRAQAKPHQEKASVPAVVREGDVPAYHAGAPRGRMPATLAPEQFSDPRTQNAYAMAAKVKEVLYQLPCYCYCDEALGHESLLDCFVTDHGAECDMCQQEAIYAYEQTRKGKTAAQIRAAVIRGKWKKIDLDKYATPRGD